MKSNSIPNNNVPKYWTCCPLSNIADINVKPMTQHLNENIEVSFLPMASVEALSGKIDLSEIRLLKDVRKGFTSFTNGDILFAKITPCMENGKIAIAQNLKNGIGFGSTEFHVIRLHEIYVRTLFFYFLVQEGFRKDAQRHMTGSAGQLRVPKSYLEEVMVPIPPLPEQHRIVTKIEQLFSDLDAGVEVLQEIRKQIRQYRQSVLKYAFEGKLTAEWRRKNKGKIESASKLLERIAEEKAQKTKGKKHNKLPPLDKSELPTLPEGWEWGVIDDITLLQQYGSSDKASEDSTGIPVLRMGNIQDGKLIYDNVKYFPSNHAEIKKYSLEPGDILFNRTNSAELVGKTAVYKQPFPKSLFASYLIRLKLSDLYIPDLLSYYINSLFGKRYIKSVVTQQVGQANVNGTKLSMMPIPIIPFEEQAYLMTIIEYHISIADKIEQILDLSERQSDRLRQSILKRAFEGRLVLQDTNDESAETLLLRIKGG